MADPEPRPGAGAEDPARTRSDSIPGRRGVGDLLRAPGNPWPSSATFGPRGLEIAGVTAQDLAARYGTPLVIVDEDDLRARCRTAVASFPRVMYAVKAFTAHAVIRIAAEEGLGLLASTGGEVEACLRAGVPASRIALHGNNKSDEELRLAALGGVGIVTIDQAAEVPRAALAAREAGRVQDVLVRVIPGVEADTHEAIATGHAESKFGVPLAQVLDVVGAVAATPGLRLAGLHAHIGSQILDMAPYLQEVETMVELAARVFRELGVAVEVLDLGGGFGIAYTEERPVALPELAALVLARVRDACERGAIPVPTVVAEPGRSVVGPAAVTIYRAGSRKEVGGATLVAVDGGMSDNIRPMLYDARYAVALASPPPPGAEVPVTVVGRHCESGDVLAEDVSLPAGLGPGDLLAFAATGAYTYSMASNYNRVGRPAVVAVRDGASELWLRREDASDLDRLEAGVLAREPDAPVPDGVVIRPARPRDARSFLDFWRAIVAEGRFVRSEEVRHPARVYRSRFRRSFTDREAQILAVEGDRVVGHVYAQREDHPVTRHVATLGLAVAADRRGAGIGSALMAEAIRWGRSVGVQKLILSVYPHNAAAIALYRKFGFVDEGRLARHSRRSSGYEDEMLMSRWLGGAEPAAR